MTFNEGFGFDGLRGLFSRSPAITSAVLLLFAASVIVYLLDRSKRLNLPVMGKPDQSYYGNDVLEGASKVSVASFAVHHMLCQY